MSDAKGRFVWHDLMTPDTSGAQAFYKAIAGWGTQPWDGPQPYTMWTTPGGGMVGGVMGLPASTDAPPHWLAYVSTPDVDATAAEATALGAQVIAGPEDIPNVGRFAVLTDPQGAAFAVYTSSNPAPASDGPAQPGEFSWHELATTDPDAAWRFYQALFGWKETSSMDMGEMGSYRMYGIGAAPFGGIFRQPPEMPGPPAWLHYIRVDDVHRVVEVIKAQGGQIVLGPIEVPGGDWIAQGLDPQGAMFAIHSLARSS